MANWIERYWDKVEVRGADECWEWMASKNTNGYGQVWAGEKHFLAHRLAWELTNGSIPEALYVCHTCDHPGCVNPSHLFIGSQAENQRDMAEKGRSNRGRKRWSAKLTREDVGKIRNLYTTGKYLQRELGEQFDVSRTQVSRIVNGKRWAWLET